MAPHRHLALLLNASAAASCAQVLSLDDFGPGSPPVASGGGEGGEGGKGGVSSTTRGGGPSTGGMADGFVARLDAHGVPTWATSVGGVGVDRVEGVTRRGDLIIAAAEVQETVDVLGMPDVADPADSTDTLVFAIETTPRVPSVEAPARPDPSARSGHHPPPHGRLHSGIAGPAEGGCSPARAPPRVA